MIAQEGEQEACLVPIHEECRTGVTAEAGHVRSVEGHARERQVERLADRRSCR